MVNRLLQRQTSLLEYLSSPAAIFGNEAHVPSGPALQGIDPGLLRLEARFACNLRIKKIIAVFPRTFEIFGDERALILHEFVATSRPTSTNSLVNAREFYDFLLARWRHEPAEPAYLPEVAACELSMADVRHMAEERDKAPEAAASERSKRRIRRRCGVVPLRCAYDIRSIIEAGLGEVAPARRDTSLVVALPAGSRDAIIVEVAPAAFDLLVRLDDWIDPGALGGIDELEDVIGHLAAHELIDVRASNPLDRAPPHRA